MPASSKKKQRVNSKESMRKQRAARKADVNPTREAKLALGVNPNVNPKTDVGKIGQGLPFGKNVQASGQMR